MNDDDPEKINFSAMSGTPGTPFGGLQDPTAVSVSLSGFTYGREAGWQWFSKAAARHKEALDEYLQILRACGGDATDNRVKFAAMALHTTVRTLPIGHAAYAGVGFPSPGYEAPSAPNAELTTEPIRAVGSALHPYVDTALSGSRTQRLALAEQPDLQVEVELILARDPDLDVRRNFVWSETRSRIAMLLMERDETDASVRGCLANQRYASPHLKFDVPLVELYPDSLEGVADLLGLDDELRAKLLRALDETDRGDEAASRRTFATSSRRWAGSSGTPAEHDPSDSQDPQCDRRGRRGYRVTPAGALL